MKTVAEVIKYVLNDGGFKVFAAKCGHKGVAGHSQCNSCKYGAFLQSAVDENGTVDKDERTDFLEWVHKLSTSSEDQVCCFWSQMPPCVCGIFLCHLTGFCVIHA